MENPRARRSSPKRASSPRDNSNRPKLPPRMALKKKKENEEPRRVEPEIPQEIYREEIEPEIKRELSSLSADNAEQTARHLIALVHFLPIDVQRAHLHGVAASARAARVGRVRELAGIAAYAAEKFDVALRELKTAFRITGDPTFWAMMADCHRGMGEPLKAIELGRAPEAKLLDKEAQVELRIVLSGARRDLGEFAAAVTSVKCKELEERNSTWSARLRYAYADALEASGDIEGARNWFGKATEVDINHETDASERLKKLST